MTACVLVVEDEPHLAQGIADNLEAEGYAVKVAGDGETALATWRAGGIDMIVLDVMLPKRDGYDVCQTIRAAGGKLPILFLTAKNSGDERIHGLDAGADDYLGKPFDLRELLLRVRAMLRRRSWGQDTPEHATYALEGFRVNLATHEVTDLDGRSETLPQKEAMIFKLLVEQPGTTVSRDDILHKVWRHEVFPSSRSIDALVVRLRRRFEPDPAQPRYFHTIRGVGYRFTPDASAASAQDPG